MEDLYRLPIFVMILFICLAGVITADPVPAEVAYIQAGHSVMNNGTDGMSELTVTGIVPYFNVANGDRNRLIPLKNLSKISTPINAALVLSDAGNETVTLISISNLTLSDDANTIVLQVKPLDFYDGTSLEKFKSRTSGEGLHAGENNGDIGIYLELFGFPPENATLPGPTNKPRDPDFVTT
jgi:hypothetical protein